jgi:hypothetical protein
MRWRDPKIKPMEGAILQVRVPTLTPGGGCWAIAGDTNATANVASNSVTNCLSMTKIPAFLELFPVGSDTDPAWKTIQNL